jgi:hypothetical protein
MTTKITPSVLANTAVTKGTYGGSSQIPVITIDKQGRITSAANTSALSTLNGTSGSASPSSGAITFAGSFGLTITGSSSTLTVATPQDIRTSASPTFSSLSLTSPLAVAQGGTAVTSSTGTGSVVLNTSPTLVTPALGTPSSGNLTNCTLTNSQITSALGYVPGVVTPYTLTVTTTLGVGGVTTISNGTAASSSSTGALVVTGGIGLGGSLYAAGNVTAYSDRRIKTDIVNIPDALEKVCKLNGITYTRTDTGERGTGVIAQEVMAVLPEAVFGSEEELYSVAYGNIVGLLIESIKELKKEIDILKGNK